METISIRLEKEFARELERVIAKYKYSTKTEFIREAIRDKIKQIKNDEVLKRLSFLAKEHKIDSEKELREISEKAINVIKNKSRQSEQTQNKLHRAYIH